MSYLPALSPLSILKYSPVCHQQLLERREDSSAAGEVGTQGGPGQQWDGGAGTRTNPPAAQLGEEEKPEELQCEE